jgi:hypothetical protein
MRVNVELRAELVMAIRDYECEKRREWAGGIDFSASIPTSDDKVLVRAITKLPSKSGVVGIDAVRDMTDTMKQKDYDHGVLVGNRFSTAARNEMRQKQIQVISEKVPLRVAPQKLYLSIQKCVDELCEAKCERVPEHSSECKGYSEGRYSCEIKRINDNAGFHFERGWTSLLKNDLLGLLRLSHSLEDEINDASTTALKKSE